MKALVVLARLPLTGRVKPRLAAKVSNALAIQFYRACAEIVISESAKCEGIHYLFYSGGTREQALEWTKDIHQDAIELQPQACWTDASGRIGDAFRQVFAAGAEMVVILSPDVPDINANLLSKTFVALESSDVVFGPTHDGGYYLVGLKSMQPSLFQDIRWGSSEVLQKAVRNATSAGLIVAPLTSLPCLYDIDTLESLRKWIKLPSSNSNSLLRLAVVIVDESKRLEEALSETGYLLVSP